MYIGIEIMTSEDIENGLIPGKNLVLNCTTDLAVILIEWLDQDGNVMANSTELVATYMVEIADAHHNQQFICNIITPFGNQTRSVDLIVNNMVQSTSSSRLVTGAVVAVLFMLLFISIVVSLVIITVKR
jgi:preprotein translocase subunit SecF